jgi:tetratricopeptide (TPR) repeat protein
MPPDERAWFEKEIEGNPSLQVEIDFHRKVDVVLADRDTIELKAQLDNIHKEIDRTAKKGHGMIKTFYRKAYAAAGVLTAVVVFVSLYLSNYNFSSNELLGIYYQPPESTVSFRAAHDPTDKLSTAMGYYEEQEYAKAINLFEEILQEDESLIGVNLYSGISHLEMEHYEIANSRFQTIIDEDPNPFVESATWYLGLCYLFTDEREKAKESFLILSESDGYYKNDAKKLLRRL